MIKEKHEEKLTKDNIRSSQRSRHVMSMTKRGMIGKEPPHQGVVHFEIFRLISLASLQLHQDI